MGEKMSEARFTPGPWCWHGSNRRIHLATVDRGKTYVMSFCRMGMREGQPTFQASRRQPGVFGMHKALEMAKFEVGDRSVTGITEAKSNESVYRYDITHLDHPDAHLIAASPDLYAACNEAFIVMSGGESSNAPFDEVRWSRAVDGLVAALAKARGEQCT
jgi:hypothetical protein